MSEVNDLKEKLLNNEDHKDAKITTGEDLRDPCNARKINLNTDYYSLTWACMQKTIFKNKQIRGEHIELIPRDYFVLYAQFLLFCSAVMVSLLLVIRESILSDNYVVGSTAIIVCRIILIFYAMVSMGPEFSEGYAKYFYTSKHQSEFTFPGFAIFVGIMQIILAATTMATVAFYVCTANYFGELLTNFSGLCVLAELDDWIGNMILNNSIQLDDHTRDGNVDENIRDLYKTNNLNERLSVMEKMSLIDGDTDLVLYYNERVSTKASWIIYYIDNINRVIPWSVIVPILLIPLSFYMPRISRSLRPYV
jgi:hypothetical protein